MQKKPSKNRIKTKTATLFLIAFSSIAFVYCGSKENVESRPQEASPPIAKKILEPSPNASIVRIDAEILEKTDGAHIAYYAWLKAPIDILPDEASLIDFTKKITEEPGAKKQWVHFCLNPKTYKTAEDCFALSIVDFKDYGGGITVTMNPHKLSKENAIKFGIIKEDQVATPKTKSLKEVLSDSYGEEGEDFIISESGAVPKIEYFSTQWKEEKKEIVEEDLKRQSLTLLLRTFIHTNLNEVKVTATPTYLDDNSRDRKKSLTLQVTRDQIKSLLEKQGISSFEELVGPISLNGEIVNDQWMPRTKPLFYNDQGPPTLNAFFKNVKLLSKGKL